MTNKNTQFKGQNPFLVFLLGATVAVIFCGTWYVKSQLDIVPQAKSVTVPQSTPIVSATQNVETHSISENASPPENPHRKTFLGQSPTGYSLWRGADECIYVVDIRESDLNRMNVSISELKHVIKEQTGARCVFFE